MLPGKVGDRGRSAEDNRHFVEAVLWIARTGSPWRDLPEEFGLWNSVFRRFARWSDAGVWAQVFAMLAQDADFEEVFLDTTIITLCVVHLSVRRCHLDCVNVHTP